MKQPPRPAPAAPGPGPADDELDFAALMQHEGVTPVTGDRRHARPARATAASASKAARGSAPRSEHGAAARPAGERTGAPARALPDRTAAPATTSPRTAEDPRLAALRHELAARTASHHAAIKERDAAVQASVALRAELASLRAAASANEASLRAAASANEASLRAAASANEAALRAQLSSLRAAQRSSSAPAEPPRSSLAAALAARGLLASEPASALALLSDGEAANRLLELLETRDPAALGSLLERRLALVCGDPACAPELGAAALRVEAARCEVCGGSDIQRAAHGFARACAAAGVVRVRFVGGSPNYRTKLAALFPAGGPLTVHTTAGDKRVRLSRSRMQQRGDDLVIIWGATELDHATSGVYRSEHGRTEVIAHRGIGRMLDLAAARITGA